MASPISAFKCALCSKLIEEHELLAGTENGNLAHETCLELIAQANPSPFSCAGCKRAFREKELKRLNSQDDLVHEDCAIAELFEVLTIQLAKIQRTPSQQELY
jgi:hypothetical protein